MFNREVAINITVTFIQGFFAAWAVTGNDLSKGAVGGAVGAGLSAVWNVVIKPRLNKS